MNSGEILSKVKDYVGSKFREVSNSENIYHNFTHTAEVVKVASEISDACGISTEDKEILQIASWFHDLGYIEKCEGHEQISTKLAEDFLNQINYPPEKTQKVISLINVTKLPRQPKNLLEEIICDADLHHIGTNEFESKSNLLRKELELKGLGQFSDKKWLKNNLKFFYDHKFYTRYAKDRFEIQKNINRVKIERKLSKMKSEEKEEDSEMEQQEDTNKKSDKKKEKEIDKGAGRSIETMFRNTLRTHVDFSSMADTKANIMISVNTLVLTIIVSIMVRKLDSNPHLVIPTAILTITSLTTLIYAILVTRPKVTSGMFTEEDIKQKKANLLFFGNFHKMGLQEFTWGMKEMLIDKDYLYDNMIKDFYYLGQVLGEKYKKLRISYTVFMWGLIISVVAFTIAFILYPGGTDLGPIIE